MRAVASRDNALLSFVASVDDPQNQEDGPKDELNSFGLIYDSEEKKNREMATSYWGPIDEQVLRTLPAIKMEENHQRWRNYPTR
ncbi:unnamed protein product [Amoebophrya sp. A120]|nr:unnamed protein product [Amoebophrya sp. A120]|eukprot:GSA120T00005098001.1